MTNALNFKGVTAKNWKDFPSVEAAPGIFVSDLWTGDNEKRVCIYEFKAGAVYDGIDVHESGPELVYVISGVFSDGRDHHKEGTFIAHPKGTSHAPQSKQGCVLLVIFPEG